MSLHCRYPPPLSNVQILAITLVVCCMSCSRFEESLWQFIVPRGVVRQDNVYMSLH